MQFGWYFGKQGAYQPISVNRIKQLHTGMKTTVVMNGRLSDEIPSTVLSMEMSGPNTILYIFSVIFMHTSIYEDH